MAATIKGRFQLKNDTEINWNKAVNFIPLKGEVIIYSVDETHSSPRLKVGDGINKIIDLPFLTNQIDGSGKVSVGTTDQWNSQLQYIPQLGEIIIYTDKTSLKDGTIIPKIKIGDGMAYCADLPFIDEDIIELISSHIDNTEVHITSEERLKWNKKITCDDYVNQEVLIFTR